VIDFLQANWLTLLFVGGCVVALALLRNRPTRVSSVGELLAKGQPVIVEVFSST